MSLHTIAPEKLGVPELWKQIRSYYPLLKSIQSYAHESDSEVYTTISDESNGGRFYAAVYDDYYGEQFIDFLGSESLTETLEKLVERIKRYISDNPIIVDEDD